MIAASPSVPASLVLDRVWRCRIILGVLVGMLAGITATSAAEPKTCAPELFRGADAKPGRARITAPERTNFRDDSGACPDETPACRRRGFVVQNDEVATAQTTGEYICALYPDLKGGSAGYLPRAAVEVLPPGPVGSKATLPLPKKGEAFFGYCERLASKFDIRVKCEAEKDFMDPSHPSDRTTLRVPWGGLAAGFELAKALFNVPASVRLPARGPAEQVVDLKPDPGRYLVLAQITINRNENGEIISASYFEKTEGSGRSVEVRRIGPELLITEQSSAD